MDDIFNNLKTRYENSRAQYPHVLIGDTDSCYINMGTIVKPNMTQKDIIKLADELGEEINQPFSDYMQKTFFVDAKKSKLIYMKREAVAKTAIFKQAKKRYAMYVIDLEGKKVDDIKITGLEIKRSDSPAFIQNFLEELVEKVLKYDATYEDIKNEIESFRLKFKTMEPWRIGSPSGVSKIQQYISQSRKHESSLKFGGDEKKPSEIITVKAALNTNKLIDKFNENVWNKIYDGDKIEYLYLKTPNEFDMDVIAIPSNSVYVPQWFKELPIDVKAMEEKLIDNKVKKILGEVFDWDFTVKKTYIDEVSKTDDFWT